MVTKSKIKSKNIDKRVMVNETIANFEKFIENRESYIKALETTVNCLRLENARYNQNNKELKNSFDEYIAMHKLSNVISTSVEPDSMIDTLIDLSKQVIPVISSNIFLIEPGSYRLSPFSDKTNRYLTDVIQAQLESGIVDWVLSEKKTVIIPDLDHMVNIVSGRFFVIVPMIIRNQPVGLFVIHTEKPQQEFSQQDIQLLSILANYVAVGVENWRTYQNLNKVNEDFKNSQAQLLQVSKMATLGELAASIMHEMKNPVQFMLAQISLAKRGLLDPNWIELFSKRVDQLVIISKRLFNFCHEDSNLEDMEPFNINKPIKDVLDLVEHDIKYKNINIELCLKEDLPDIYGKPAYIQLVLLNLIINARDAMPNGGKIVLSTSTMNSHVEIKCSDSGLGIAADKLERIFEPFFTTKPCGTGTGLGLSISKKIINQHHGKMSVDSVINEGTVFTIQLPIRRKKNDQ